MKNINNLLLLFLWMTVSSCNDYLDMSPKDVISDELEWSDKELINTNINQLYGYLGIAGNGGKNITGVEVRLTEECYSDNAEHCAGFFMDIHNVTKGTINSSYCPIVTAFTFDDIRHVNIALKRLPETTCLTDNEKKSFIAQCKFFRAYFYAQKIKNYGGLPILKEPLGLEDETALPRNTMAECYDFILSDLKEAVPNLPVTWPSGELGRVTRGAALCLKSRVELYAERYEEAIKTCEEAMTLGYDLEEDYKALFNTRDTYKKSKEALLTIQFRTPERTHQMELHQNPNRGRQIYGWGAACPTQDLVDEYMVVDKDGIARKWDESQTFKENWPIIGTHAMWLNRDKRFYATIVHDSAVIEYPGAKQYIEMTTDPNSYLNKEPVGHCSHTGYLCRKFKYEGSEAKFVPNGDNPSETHWVLFRYAEVLLNYAEALIYSGREQEALAPINIIRKRAGLPALTTTTNIIENYRRERRIEFAFELHRYWDMIRWAKKEGNHAIPEFARAGRCLWIEPDRHHYQILQSTDTRYQRTFETPKRYLFPIPFNEIVKNPNLAQNPGWE
ncbi:MAG: RagB/SusD family nutrient uptake outer membrane protein [Tannerellaceae bacterium]